MESIRESGDTQALSINFLLYDTIETLKGRIKALEDENLWLRIQVDKLTGKLSNIDGSFPVNINKEDMTPISGIELPSERKSRLAKESLARLKDKREKALEEKENV
jgi:regulator of replication initiation timing